MEPFSAGGGIKTAEAVSKANLSDWHPKDAERNPRLLKARARGDKSGEQSEPERLASEGCGAKPALAESKSAGR